MGIHWGPAVFGIAFLFLSLHPFAIEGLAGLVPINERSERPVFASAGLVLTGMAFLAYGCFAESLRGRRRRPSERDSAAQAEDADGST